MAYKVHSVDGKSGEVVLTHLRTQTRNLVVASPGVANHVLWRAPAACTVTAVRGYCTGGTSAAINASTAGGDVLTANLVCAAGSWVSHAADANAAVAAGDTVTVKVTAATGSPTELNVQVEYTVSVP